MNRRYGVLLVVLLMMSISLIAQDASPQYYTHHQIDGNRVVSGQGTFPQVEILDFPLDGLPVWVVGDGERWFVALADGSVQQATADGEIIDEAPLPPGTPPVIVGGDLLRDYSLDASLLTHPVMWADRTIYIAESGDIVLLDDTGTEIARYPLAALPDGRIVVDGESGLAAVYSGATNQRYVHAIMGDDLEGSTLTLIDLANAEIVTTIVLSGDEVFEGIAPIWADVDADGTADLITTVSFPGGGAQIRVYRVDGSLMTSGPAIGQSNRWRHQLAWLDFGPNGVPELVEVLTPHIGGIVGFYQYDGDDTLEIVARQSGYTSHVIGSRNLDLAVAGDFDGDGQPEIVLANQMRSHISGLAHTGEGEVSQMWELRLGGILQTNLAAAVLPDDGGLVLAAGIRDQDGNGVLRVWRSMP